MSEEEAKKTRGGRYPAEVWPALTMPIRVALRLLTVKDFLRIRFESLPTNRDS